MARFFVMVLVVLGGMGVGFGQDDSGMDELFDDSAELTAQAAADSVTIPKVPPPVQTDWFAKFEAMYIDQLEPPEDNGMRDVLAALGPAGLEQGFMARTVPWDEFATDERSREWYKNVWVPLCEKIGIDDPSAKPAFLGYRELEEYLQFYGVTGEEPTLSEDPDQRITFFQESDVRHPDRPDPKLSGATAQDWTTRFQCFPWTASDSPTAARWLEETSPLLDLWSDAVRKPHYVSYTQRAALIAILLPEVQASRSLARSLETRIMANIGAGAPGSKEIDDAIRDIETMFLFSRNHCQESPFVITRLVGVAVEGNGGQAAAILLRSGKMSSDQLERLAKILDELPPMASIDRFMESEEMMCLEMADRVLFFPPDSEDVAEDLASCELFIPKTVQRILRATPLDQTLVHGKIHESYVQARAILQEPNGLVREEKFAEFLQPYENANEFFRKNWAAIFSNRVQSELFSKLLFRLYFPALRASLCAFDRADDQRNLLRIGVAIERYRITAESDGLNGENSEDGEDRSYPATLETLVDAGLLDAVPVDSYNGLPLIYSPNPFVPPEGTPDYEAMERTDDRLERGLMTYSFYYNQWKSPYVLYSLGQNGQDDTAKLNGALREEIDDGASSFVLSTFVLPPNDDIRL